MGAMGRSCSIAIRAQYPMRRGYDNHDHEAVEMKQDRIRSHLVEYVVTSLETELSFTAKMLNLRSITAVRIGLISS